MFCFWLRMEVFLVEIFEVTDSATDFFSVKRTKFFYLQQFSAY